MKLVLILALCGLAVAAPNYPIPISQELDALIQNAQRSQERNWLDNLMAILFETLRGVMINGSPSLGIPVLDPLHVEKADISVPAGIVNLDLDLEDIRARGLSGFRIHTGRLDLIELSLDLDLTIPHLHISAGHYNLLGDLLSAIPLFGKGKAVFKIDNLHFRGKVYLGQSENKKSIIIDRLENVGFKITNFESGLTGAIGGGDIDDVINALIGEVVIDYVNRFQGYLSHLISELLPEAVNPVLERFESWYIIENIQP